MAIQNQRSQPGQPWLFLFSPVNGGLFAECEILEHDRWMTTREKPTQAKQAEQECKPSWRLFPLRLLKSQASRPDLVLQNDRV